MASKVTGGRRSRLADRLFRGSSLGVALGLAALLVLMVVVLVGGGDRVFARYGLGFLFGRNWNPVPGREQFGAFPFVFGTLVTSAIAIVLAVPVAIGLALLLNERARGWVGNVLAVFVDLLAAIQQTKGAVGYVEYQYAATSSLGVAAVKGKSSSDYVSPSVSSISAAGGGLTLPISSTTNVLNSSASGAYPLTSTTYFMAYEDLTPLGKDKAQTIVDLVHWMLTDGQGEVKDLNFAPLPSSVATQALAQLKSFQFQGKTLPPSS